MISPIRRRQGLALLVLLVVQSIAAPAAACAREHAGLEAGGHEMAMMGHSADEHGGMEGSTHEDPVADSGHEPDRMPTACAAMAACGAPALAAPERTLEVSLAAEATRHVGAGLDRPVAVVLGLATPPPKI